MRTSRIVVPILTVIALSSSVQTQSPPDFAGVYRPINAFGPAGGGRGAATDTHRAALGRIAGPGADGAATHA